MATNTVPAPGEMPEEVAAKIRRATLIAINAAPPTLAAMPEFRDQVRREVDRLMCARLGIERTEIPAVYRDAFAGDR